jgi:hypothetical protein
MVFTIDNVHEHSNYINIMEISRTAYFESSVEAGPLVFMLPKKQTFT